MNKMPSVWLLYLKFLMSQRLITRTRRAFNRALQSLPITQHTKIWPLFLDVRRAPAPHRARPVVLSRIARHGVSTAASVPPPPVRSSPRPPMWPRRPSASSSAS
jgi:hypothetical protein